MSAFDGFFFVICDGEHEAITNPVSVKIIQRTVTEGTRIVFYVSVSFYEEQCRIYIIKFWSNFLHFHAVFGKIWLSSLSR